MQEIVTYVIILIALGFAVKWFINQTKKRNDEDDESGCGSNCCSK